MQNQRTAVKEMPRTFSRRIIRGHTLTARLLSSLFSTDIGCLKRNMGIAVDPRANEPINVWMYVWRALLIRKFKVTIVGKYLQCVIEV